MAVLLSLLIYEMFPSRDWKPSALGAFPSLLQLVSAFCKLPLAQHRVHKCLSRLREFPNSLLLRHSAIAIVFLMYSKQTLPIKRILSHRCTEREAEEETLALLRVGPG